MGPMLVFLAVIAAIGGWWLSRQRLTAKPWLEEGALGEHPGTAAIPVPAAKLGLAVFLVVAGALFTLLISAYLVRVDLAGLRIAAEVRLPAPRLLWFNTGALVLSSILLQMAAVEARQAQPEGARMDLVVGAISALTFVAGQLLVWRQLTQAGYLLASNPGASFFYLLTGAHALHVLGGLAALARVHVKLWRAVPLAQVRQSIELCAAYWHFLLLVWIVLLALLMGWAEDFVGICRALVG